MTINYIFRYRDLIANDTIRKHREIIQLRQACWWGWWQRPSEDLRRDVWSKLQSALKKGTVQIGLFDSDPGKKEGLIYVAALTDVIPPTETGAALGVPETDMELVPEYYRLTAFSSAWLKLNAIDEKPLPTEQFFRRYSYDNLPSLRGIADDDLKKYANKLVVDAAELRSMDTTIWEVRPAKQGDSSERILATSSRITSALAADPITLRTGRILHLSDIHLTQKEHRKQHRWKLIGEDSTTLHAKVLNALKKNDLVDIGLVVISGDLTYMASREEFYEAFRFVHALLGALRLGPEHLVVIPGNHDIAWSRKHGDVWKPDLPVDEIGNQPPEEYKTFYQRVFGHLPSTRLNMARRFVMPSGLVLDVGGLNTSALETGADWLTGMGRVADGAFSDVELTLGWSEPGPALRMLVLHHHVSAVEDVMPSSEHSKGFGMASDARQTLRKAASAGVQLVLHGHRHLPFLSVEQVYAGLDQDQSQWLLGRVSVVGAGSAGSTDVNDNSNYFNVFDITPARVGLTMFRARSPEQTRADFDPLTPWEAELSWKNGQLFLGDWERKRDERG
jgi:3',5'-cyclic AMP phosphodiesterase CpdA